MRNASTDEDHALAPAAPPYLPDLAPNPQPLGRNTTTPAYPDPVTCATCGTENPDRARFCMSCGASLPTACATCGAANPAGAKFCIECGHSLGGEAASPARAGVEEPPPEERRKATVIFADLSGYTAVSERLDPERIKSLVDRALRRLGEEVERHGGTIDKYIGDNVMGVFGAPIAHEDDPERAVRAGLAMQAAMDEINERTADDLGASFALRVGINSGDVLAGRVGDGYTVIGDPVNVAARLQSAAEPGTVIVGETTHRLTRSAIEYVELEPLRLKGKSEPVPAWEAVRAVVRGRAPRGPRTATPLVGRDDESERLLCAVRADRERGAPAPGHRDRPGRGRQVAPAARAGPQRRRARAPGGRAARKLPRLRRRGRLLGARRGRPRDLRHRRHRRRGGRLAQAQPRHRRPRRLLRHRGARRADRRRARPAARHRAPRRTTAPSRTSTTTPSRCATGSSRRSGP